MSKKEALKWSFALVVVVATVVAFDALYGRGRGTAFADEARTTVEIKLAPGQKLVDVSWHCFSDFACAPFVLTRAMRKDEASETYGFSSLDADIRRSYVIKESR